MMKKIWNSPTFMTWMSYSTKTLSLFGVLPLILKRFNSEDIVLWYLFSTIISLQSIADFGFRATFARIISYAFWGASDIVVFKPAAGAAEVDQKPNVPLMANIVSTMKRIYKWLTVFLIVLMAIFGTWSMFKPVSVSSDINGAWISWVIVVLVSSISFYSKIYMNFLEGLFKIAIVRRIETLTSLGSILTSILVLMYAPSILNLVIVNQFWVLIVSIRDWYLCKTVDNGFYKTVSYPVPFDKQLFLKIWAPAWRGGISSFMSAGLTNLAGLLYAQVGDSTAVASYLLALRVINQIKDISMAPFYSKLPLLAKLRVANDLKGLVKICRKSMLLSHLAYVIGFILVGLFSNQLMKLTHSHVNFVSPWLWVLIGIAFFVQRYGAMHMQVYLSTNHIISHIADGVSGVLFMVSSIILVKYLNIYAIPVGMLVGYLGFYAWYAALYSCKSLKTNFWSFEAYVSAFPISIIIVYIVYLYGFVNT